MKGKILVIEDNPKWQNKLRKYLEADGFFVEVVSDLGTAIKKVREDRFHFITVDMQLNEKNRNAEEFEGWGILDVIKKLRIQDITPVMVITGYGAYYKELKNSKNVESLFLREKGKLDKQDFLKIINDLVGRIDLRFKDDHRGNV